jgi:hypothetical protein
MPRSLGVTPVGRRQEAWNHPCKTNGPAPLGGPFPGRGIQEASRVVVSVLAPSDFV